MQTKTRTRARYSQYSWSAATDTFSTYPSTLYLFQPLSRTAYQTIFLNLIFKEMLKSLIVLRSNRTETLGTFMDPHVLKFCHKLHNKRAASGVLETGPVAPDIR
jgi:hypothetical protein